jgi:NAD(P)-dependent dehydrogenase (short-subunit alcohol dehydrogenase family)
MQRGRVALVTGASRGIGLAIVKELARRGLTIILTARDEKKGRDACCCARREGLDAVFHELDVREAGSIRDAVGFAERRFGRLDVLVNNAAISTDPHETALGVDAGEFRKTFETNLMGPLQLCQAAVPLMKTNGYGRIVNVSSARGAFHALTRDNAAYRVSKAALNALTCILADELNTSNVLVNAVAPGWVRTHMGGIRAPRSVEQGADTAVWLATLPDDGPRGGFFKDREEQPW